MDTAGRLSPGIFIPILQAGLRLITALTASIPSVRINRGTVSVATNSTPSTPSSATAFEPCTVCEVRNVGCAGEAVRSGGLNGMLELGCLVKQVDLHVRIRKCYNLRMSSPQVPAELRRRERTVFYQIYEQVQMRKLVDCCHHPSIMERTMSFSSITSKRTELSSVQCTIPV